jgi:hypothetical protein
MHFKAGFVHLWGFMEQFRPYNGDIASVTTVNGVANSVSVTNSPMFEHDDLNADLGIYVQDRWTMERFEAWLERMSSGPNFASSQVTSLF